MLFAVKSATKCDICLRPIEPPHKYCPRCSKFICRAGRGMAHVNAPKRDYDPVHDVFRCHYTGVVLEEKDTKSPKYLTYDHLIPGLKTVDNEVITMALINEIKTDMTYDEFLALAREIIRHEDRGGAFDERVLDIKHRYRMIGPAGGPAGRI